MEDVPLDRLLESEGLFLRERISSKGPSEAPHDPEVCRLSKELSWYVAATSVGSVAAATLCTGEENLASQSLARFVVAILRAHLEWYTCRLPSSSAHHFSSHLPERLTSRLPSYVGRR